MNLAYLIPIALGLGVVALAAVFGEERTQFRRGLTTPGDRKQAKQQAGVEFPGHSKWLPSEVYPGTNQKMKGQHRSRQ